MISWSWEVIRTQCGWNSSSAERPNRCCCHRRYLSLSPTNKVKCRALSEGASILTLGWITVAVMGLAAVLMFTPG